MAVPRGLLAPQKLAGRAIPEQMLICPFPVCAGRVTSRPSGERPSVQCPPPTQSSSSSSKSREECRVVGSHFRLIIAGAKSAGFCQTWHILVVVSGTNNGTGVMFWDFVGCQMVEWRHCQNSSGHTGNVVWHTPTARGFCRATHGGSGHATPTFQIFPHSVNLAAAFWKLKVGIR